MTEEVAKKREEARFTSGEFDPVEADDEAEQSPWMLSYVDLLTLLITLFVALVSKARFGPEGDGRRSFFNGETAARIYVNLAPPPLQLEELRERTREILSFLEREQLGGKVSVVEEGEDSLLVIPASLLLAENRLKVSETGAVLLEKLSPLLQAVKGRISVEGYPEEGESPAEAAVRASSVAARLVASGLSESRLRFVSYWNPAAGSQVNGQHYPLLIRVEPRMVLRPGPDR